MFKRAFFLLLLFWSAALFALTDAQLLKRAESHVRSERKSDVFEAYNDFKNLYLRALMQNNDTLRKKALQGIVKSGKKLHIDVRNYEKELELFLKKRPHSKKLKQKKTLRRKTATKRTSKKSKKPTVRATNKLKLVYWKNGRLILRFQKPLKKHQVNFFRLYNAKKNEYKYVFDIEASMMTRSQRLIKSGIRTIRMAQYKPNIIRLVFVNSKPLVIRFKISRNELVINAGITSATSKKSTHKNVKSKHNKQTALSKSLHAKTIVIDPGHGGKDPGASGYRKYREKNVVLNIGKYVRDYLKKRGYRVYMTRDRDRFIKLSRRTKYANKKRADLFISIHSNASKNTKAHGIETYFLSPSRSRRAERVAAMENKADIEEMNFYGKQSFLKFMNNHKIIASNKLAIDIQQSILSELRKHYKGIADAGVREGPFWVLVGAQMPSVLIEVGFITNKTEARRLVNRRYQMRIAKGIADGIERYFMKNR